MVWDVSSHNIIQPFKPMVKLKPLHYQNASGHKTWKGNDLLQGASTHTFTVSCEIKWQIKSAYLH